MYLGLHLSAIIGYSSPGVPFGQRHVGTILGMEDSNWPVNDSLVHLLTSIVKWTSGHIEHVFFPLCYGPGHIHDKHIPRIFLFVSHCPARPMNCHVGHTSSTELH
jgi:hypothetical protein